MIRMVQSSSAGHAKAYFSDALLKSDYYLDDQELQGRLLGKLAERLGIEGVATKENFYALCENQNPVTKKPLTPRTKEDRTTGYDINFHCPKSVSIVHALSDYGHIVTAFQESVRETMKDIEADSKTRVKKNGKNEERETGELAYAEFIHQTARPVDGTAPDPHLHAHVFVFNATFDKVENRIKAGQFRDINRDMPYYQARFHKRLSDKLIDAGYRVKLTAQSFEVVGVPQSAIDLFSKRSNEIGKFAKEKGITDKEELAGLGARTRSKKQKGLSMAELKKEWRRQIKEAQNSKEGENDMIIRFAPKHNQPSRSSKDCIDYALGHSFERASVMADRRLLEVAYKQGIGHRSVEEADITASFISDPRIIHVKEKYRTYCTTKEVLAEEKEMVGLARQGLGKFRPLYEKAPALELDGQQAEAVANVLTTNHQVSIIRGAAGSGKTTLMQEAAKWIERSGKTVTVVAPTAKASRGVLVDEGFRDAQTVAKLLVDVDMQKALKGQVLWVDEAGLLGTKDMSALLRLAKKQDARLILGGDTRQHSSVIRGDALRILNTVGGIETAEVSKIYRQRDVHYREAVEHLSRGNVKEGFDKLDNMGSIRNIDPMNPNEALVDDYIKTVKRGKSALIVSPTHKQGEAVTGEVRYRLKSEGMLGKKELSVKKLSNINLTEAQKTDRSNFQEGQFIQFKQNGPKIKRGSLWKVDAVQKENIRIKNAEGVEELLPLGKPDVFDVFKQTEIGLSKGDKVKITRNGFDENQKRLNNGQSLEVLSIKKSGQVVLGNKTSKTTHILDKDFGHIDHDYCTTSHSAQGRTVDHVLISQPASTFGATDAKQFYVSVSRGRDSATVYTDDRVALLGHASEMGDRKSALELVKGKKHSGYVQQRERENYLSKDRSGVSKQDNSINKNHKGRDREPEL